MNDVALAAAAARAAADVLLPLRGQGSTGHELGDAGDAAAQRAIAALLAEHRPDDAVLSEEAADDPARLGADRVWIVDPLDGTKEYRAGDRHDWAVHVALWERGADDLTVGAVGLPALGERCSPPTPRPSSRRCRPARCGWRCRARAPRRSPAAADALDAVLVPMGSAGYKTLAVVRGEADAYVHAGACTSGTPPRRWAVARAGGLHTSRLDGSPLVYNAAEAWLPDLVVCRPSWRRGCWLRCAGGMTETGRRNPHHDDVVGRWDRRRRAPGAPAREHS